MGRRGTARTLALTDKARAYLQQQGMDGRPMAINGYDPTEAHGSSISAPSVNRTLPAPRVIRNGAQQPFTERIETIRTRVEYVPAEPPKPGEDCRTCGHPEPLLVEWPGGLRWDSRLVDATVRGEPLNLTHTEARIFAALARRAGHVLPHATILRTVWGEEWMDYGDRRTGPGHLLRVNICRLRAKLAHLGFGDVLRTRTGVGYGLIAPREEAA